MTRPRSDPYLAGLGVEVEDLSRIAEGQPYRARGPELTLDGLRLMHGLLSRRVEPGRLPGADREQFERLVDAELAVPDGALTPHGRDLAGLLGACSVKHRIEATDGRSPSTFDAYGHEGRYTVVATAAPAAPGREDPPGGAEIARTAGAVTVDLVHESRLPAVMASWLGIGPAWSIATSPEQFPRDLLAARVERPETEPPPEADANLREVWRRPWVLWTLTTTAGTSGLNVVHAAGRGHFAVGRGDFGEHVRFVPVPSHALFVVLLRCLRGETLD